MNLEWPPVQLVLSWKTAKNRTHHRTPTQLSTAPICHRPDSYLCNGIARIFNAVTVPVDVAKFYHCSSDISTIITSHLCITTYSCDWKWTWHPERDPDWKLHISPKSSLILILAGTAGTSFTSDDWCGRMPIRWTSSFQHPWTTGSSLSLSYLLCHQYPSSYTSNTDKR